MAKGAAGGYLTILRSAVAQRGLAGLYQGYSAGLTKDSMTQALGFASYEVRASAGCLACRWCLLMHAASIQGRKCTRECASERRRECVEGLGLQEQKGSFSPSHTATTVIAKWLLQGLCSGYRTYLNKGDPPSTSTRGVLGGLAAFIVMTATMPLENVSVGQRAKPVHVFNGDESGAAWPGLVLRL